MRAHRMSERAARAGFAFPDVADILTKIDCILSRLKDLVEKDRKEEISKEFGDLLLTIVVLGRLLKVHAETPLDQSLHRFVKEFKSIEPTLSREKQDTLV